MSETNEHSADDTETEPKTVDLPNDSIKSEVKLMMNQTDTALLEDEEMPTYISVSSTSRPNDSDVVNAKQQENVSQEMQESHSASPAPCSDDEEGSSIYVVSSEEETEHEDEDGDSEDMENLELDNEFGSESHLHELNMKHLMDEDDDEEEEDDEEDDEEGLRHTYNDGHPKNSHLRPDYLNIPHNAMMYSMVHRKPGPAKYQHVESPVKRYIKNMKELRRSSDKQKQYQEDVVQNQNNTDHKINDAEKSKIPNKIIKDYAERAIKQLEIEEACDRDTPPYNATTAILNGQDNKNGLPSIHEESTQDEVQINVAFDATQNEKDPLNTDDKTQKQNGVEDKEYNIHDRRTPLSFANVTVQQPLIQNGHQDVSTLFYNLRTVTYQDYMRDSHSTKINVNKTVHASEQEQAQSETYNDAEPMEVTIENDTSCPIKIENIKSIRAMGDEVKNNIEQATFDKNEEFNQMPSHVLAVESRGTIAPRAKFLKETLDLKTTQYNKLLEAYKKQLEENIKLKQEVKELRTSLANEREKNKLPEQKVVSIQTDITDCVPNKENQNKIESTQIKHNKMSINSIGSTLSSIEQWSDSSGTLSISMKPPEAVKVSHSDDSMMLTDPIRKKLSPSLSHAFITSSRILKTLSNITQGKPQSESPRIQNSKRRLNESIEMEKQNEDSGCQARPSSSKKRKLTDILKSFNASVESCSSVNETSNGKSQFKYSCDSANDKAKSQETSNVNTSHLKLNANNETENDDCYPEDNVKCYVYQENENKKDLSFLILAEEPKDDKIGNEKGRIRECGPYLLSNMEVRMSEVNGTINIWGKEIGQKSCSTAESEDEIETSTSVKDDKNGLPRTPYIRFNGSNLVCSTSQKSKIPPKFELSSVASNFSCIHTSSFNTKPSCSTEKGNTADLYSSCVSSFEDCDSSKHHKECPRYKQTHQGKLHSCYIHDALEHSSLYTEKPKFQNNCDCSKEKLNSKPNVEPNKHLSENSVNAEEDSTPTCRCHAVRHLHNHEENCQESHKCNHVCACEPESGASKYLSPMCENEPLIEKCNETPETRRRRLTGKRVRGILMDLLRDCCSPSSTSKSCTYKKESSTGCTSQIKLTPCTSAEQSCSNPRHSVGRCCRAYAQRIESQLEEFRVEMERVRSRSDAILNMLNMLHSVDTN